MDKCAELLHTVNVSSIEKRPMTTTGTRKVSVLLAGSDYDRFESFCKQQGFKKSTLVAKLIRDYLQKDVSIREPEKRYGRR
jgi:hypothetical protein